MPSLTYLHTLLASALLALAATPAHAANEALHVLDYSELSQSQGSLFVRSTIKTELALAIIRANMSVLVLSMYNGQNDSCFASVGITHPTDQWHTPRIPGFVATRLAFANKSKPDFQADCVEKTIKDAVRSLNATDPQRLLQDTMSTNPMGGARSVQPERRTINFISYGIKHQDLPLQLFNDAKFETAFDYRSTTVVFDASAWSDGTYVSCSALAGITSTPPGGRNPFMPARWYQSSFKSNQTTPDLCKKAAVRAAAQKLLAQPYNEQGILKDFERTRELGIPTPSSGSISMAFRRAGISPAGPAGSMKSAGRGVDSCGQVCTGPACAGPKPLVAADSGANGDCKPSAPPQR